MTKTAVVICPGRGTYNAPELGYLSRHFPDSALLADFDAIRREAGQEPVSALDGAASFSFAKHGRGDNASALIYAATLGDFLSIQQGAIDIVAVTGNSMGWYSALACGGAVTPSDGFRIANTMGTLMQDALIGGQTVYPWMNEAWQDDQARRAELLGTIATIDARDGHDLALSIDLGGMLVIAGNKAGLDAFEAAVPKVDSRFPMRLTNHAAFHTHLQAPVAQRGQAQLADIALRQPAIPMVDGRGGIWWPGSSDLSALRSYTLGHQVTETYDFSRAIAVAAREFAPDLFIITGPGTTLGGAVAQSLILAGWQGMASKADFKAVQDDAALLLSMGMESQRALATGAA